MLPEAPWVGKDGAMVVVGMYVLVMMVMVMVMMILLLLLLLSCI